MGRCFIFAFFTVLFFSCSCSRAPDKVAADGKFRVFVSIEPQKYLVDRIGGKYTETSVMVPEGQDPHDYAPLPGKIMALSRAMIYFETGIPFEKRIVDKIKHSGIKILLIDSSKGIKRIPMSEGILSGGEHDEHHDEHHEAHHGGREALDPHVWNSVKNLEIMSANILDGLCKAAPSSKDYFKKNYGELVSELKKLDGEIATLLNPFRGRAFFVFHPAFGYFAESYGLKQRAIEIDGKSPSPKQIRALIAKARREKVKIIFVEPQFGDESARTVAKALDGAVMVINPLPENPVDNFRNIAEKLKKAFTGVE